MPSLNPLEEVLDFRRAKHLLRRVTCNYSKTQLDSIALLTAPQAVEKLFVNDSNNSLTEPTDPTGDGDWTTSTEHPNTFNGQGRKRALVTGWWWYNSINRVTLKHKLSFFLHTCFTVGKDSGAGTSSSFYDYVRLLDYYALGNIKTLAKKITLDNSMLNYLDNSNNNANNPNENYAREFLELFTIQKGPQIGDGNYTNYTELDVQLTAKVFSGFKKQTDRLNIDLETMLPMGYAKISKHDTNNKVFSAAFGNTAITGGTTEEEMFQELDDFVEMVFAQEETAKSFCRRLYRQFVKSIISTEVETDIIAPLATLLITNNYEIKPVLETLFSSQHFYDKDDLDATDEIVGSIIKSPLQLLNEVSSFFNVSIPNPTTAPLEFYKDFYKNFIHDTFLDSAGMNFYNPDTVAGYPAYYQEPDFNRHWFSSNTIIARYKLIESLIAGKDTIGSGNIYAILDTVTFVKDNIAAPSNSMQLITELSDYLYPEAIDISRITYFENILLDGYNQYYWTSAWEAYINNNDTTIVKSRLDSLIIAMVNAGEFQLM